MKKILFLIGLLYCTCTFTHAMLFLDNKGERENEEERSISDPVKIEIKENLWILHFEKAVGDISIQIMDEYGAILYEEFVTIDTPQSIHLPITNEIKSCTLMITNDRLNLNIPII